MALWWKDLKKGLRNDGYGKKIYDWRIQERWEDYPFPSYFAKHTYCRVSFDQSGRTYYYRTRNPEIRVGDTVVVPVGYRYEEKVGKVVSIKEYRGIKAPFPLAKTKYIKRKVDEKNA